MATRKKRKKSIIVRLLVLGVCIYMMSTLISLWSELSKSQKEYDILVAEHSKQQLEIEELKTLLEDGSREEIIEQAARERLGFVYSDEEIYIDISGN